MSRLDAIIQKTESIVLVAAAREHVVSHLLQGFHDIALSMTRVLGLKNSPSLYFGSDDSKQSEEDTVKYKSSQE